MVSLKLIAILLASSTAVLGAPMPTVAIESVSARQAMSVPKNSLYLVEWYPEGCAGGKGGGMTLNGAEQALGTCTKPGGAVPHGEKPTASSVRFLFPDDGRVYKWQVFGSEGCNGPELVRGNGTQCVDVPKKNAKFGGVIVFT